MDSNIMTKMDTQHWELFVLMLREIAEQKGITHEQISETKKKRENS